MKRRQGNLTSSVYSPNALDFAATGKTQLITASFHPPSYMSWDRKIKDVKHYAVAAGNEDSPSAWVYPQAIDLCGAGFMQLVRWSYMEPTQNSYVFTAILNALSWMAANRPDKKLFIRIRDKNYTSTNTTTFLSDANRNLPDYMDGHVYQVYQGGSPSGWGHKMWETFVRDRYLALVAAMGAAFGSHDSLGGVVFDESTLSMVYPYPGDYDQAANADHRKAILTAAKSAFKNKVIIQPYNYWDATDSSSSSYGKQGPDFVTWCIDNGIQLALVDTCPTTPSFIYSMSEVLTRNVPVYAIVDAGRVYPRTDMSAGVAVANMTGNFGDIKAWYSEYENVPVVMWPISDANTMTALQAVLG